MAVPNRIDKRLDVILGAVDICAGPSEITISVLDHKESASSPFEAERILARLLYLKLHSGSPGFESKGDLAPAVQRDLDFERKLLNAGVPETRRQRFARADTGGSASIAVMRGVQVLVPESLILESDNATITVRVPSSEPRLSLGFLYYTSPAGGGSDHPLLRLYKRIENSHEAVNLWREFTSWVDENKVPLQAKVVSQSWAFPRTDALVVYLPQESWSLLPLAEAVLRTPTGQMRPSPLVQDRGHGIGLAWEPDDVHNGTVRMSFGEHRTRVIASAIVHSAVNRVDLQETLREQLIAANIDPARIHRNLNSPSLRQDPTEM